MGQRQDDSIRTKDGRVLVTTVSTEFGLVKLETDDGRNEITLDIHDLKSLADWVEKVRGGRA